MERSQEAQLSQVPEVQAGVAVAPNRIAILGSSGIRALDHSAGCGGGTEARSGSPLPLLRVAPHHILFLLLSQATPLLDEAVRATLSRRCQ